MLQVIADWVTYSLLRFDSASQIGGVVRFFLYDSIKIFILLYVMILVIGFLRTYLPEERIKTWLNQKSGLSHLTGSLFGAVTPFCSCSSVPIFIGFVKAGIPLGVTFSFLVTSPLINEYLVVLMLGFFGWKITVAYVASGILIGVASGFVIGRLNLERYLVTDLIPAASQSSDAFERKGFHFRVRFGNREAIDVIQKIWIWVLVGVGLGALIHNYIPQEFIQSIIQKAGPFSVPIATIIGVPLYGSCAAIVPIAVVLFEKGFPLGTALSFMMAVAALSLPEAIILRRAMKLELIAVFFGVTSAAIMLTGYLFNLLQTLLI